MRGVTTGATFRLYRNMLIDERPLLVGMALCANRVAAGECSRLPKGCGAVGVVAIAAPKESFVNPVVIRLGKVSLGGSMASVAEIGLSSHQQERRFLRVMRGVAIQAANIVAGM